MNYDSIIFSFFHGIVGTSSFLDFLGVFFAKYWPYFLIVYFFTFLLFSKRDWKKKFYEFTLVATSCIIGNGIIVALFRLIYFKPRPPLVFVFDPLISLPDSSSFPSGHATFFAALAFAVFCFSKKRGWFYFVSAIVIGIARIFVGVHYPLDILAGLVLGAVSAFIAWMIFKKDISLLNEKIAQS